VDGRVVIGVLIGLVAVWAALVALLWVLRPRDVGLGELVRVVPDVLRLVRNLIADRRVALSIRIALVGLLIWLISPIDLIPEFIPVLGPLDDVIVAVLVLRFVARRLGSTAVREHWAGTEDGYRVLTGILGLA
jgi:uncharacterized membrane protein YkvA (DUF1232 family)